MFTVAVVVAVGLVALHASPASRPHHPSAIRAADGSVATQSTRQPVHYGAHPIKTSGNTYGNVPAWLGRATVPVGRVVTATARHPWLAIQGDTVRVEFDRARVLATMAGPAVPEEGKVPVPRTSPCTFTLTLTGASAALALAPSQFRAIDEEGRLHTLRVTSSDGAPPPRHVLPGQAVQLKMSTVLPIGEGRIMWTPVASSHPIVQWDFEVEID